MTNNFPPNDDYSFEDEFPSGDGSMGSLIEVVCQHFRASWQNNEYPEIRPYMEGWTGDAASSLFTELLKEDIECRREAGCSLDEQDYLSEFPEFDAQIRTSFEMSTVAERSRNAERDSERAAAISLPRNFGNYQLLERLGQGGMGTVYRAKHLVTGRIVALKCIRQDGLSRSPASRRTLLARFYREVISLSSIDHDHVVMVYDVAEHEQQPFFTMRFIEGRNLVSLAEDGELSEHRMAEIVEQIALGVQAAHRAGILHRDIKPHNILVDDRNGRAVLTDFGLARLETNSVTDTDSALPLGTPAYMAPEQVTSSQDVGVQTDVYGLGATLYHLLTGRPPFAAPSLMETLLKVESNEPVPPRRRNPRISVDLETICLRCMEKDRSKRYSNPGEVAEDLQRFRQGKAILAQRPGVPRRMWNWCRKRPLQLILTIVTIALLLTIGVAAYVIPILNANRERAAGEARQAKLDKAKLVRQQEADRAKQREAELARQRESHFDNAKLFATDRPMGWSWQAEKELAQIAELDDHCLEDPEFRSLATKVVSALDVRRVHVIHHNYRPEAVTFVNDGTIAVGACKGFPTCALELIDCEDASVKQKYEIFNGIGNGVRFLMGQTGFQEGFRSLDVDEQHGWMVAGTRHGVIHAWNLRDGGLVPKSWNAHRGVITAVAITEDGSSLVSLSNDEKIVRVWSLASRGKLLREIQLSARGGMSHSPKGDAVVVWPTKKGLCELSGPQLQHERFFAAMDHAQFTSDGRQILAWNRSKATFQLIDRMTLRRQRRLDRIGLEQPFFDVPRLGQNERFVLLKAGESTDFLLCDLRSGEIAVRLSHSERPSCPFAVSPDGRRIAVLGLRDTTIFEVRSSNSAGTLKSAFAPIQALDCTADGDFVVGLCELRDEVRSSAMTAWDSQTGEQVNQFCVELLPGSRNYFDSHRAHHHVSIDQANGRIACVHPMLGTVMIDSSWLISGKSPSLEFANVRPNARPRIAQEKLLGDIAADQYQFQGDPLAVDKQCCRIQSANPAMCSVEIPASIVGEYGIYAAVRPSSDPESPTAPRPYVLRLVHRGDVADSRLASFLLHPEKGQSSVDVLLDYVLFVPMSHDGMELLVTETGPVKFSPSGQRLWGITREIELTSWNPAAGIIDQSHSNRWEHLRTGNANFYCLDVDQETAAVGTRDGKIMIVNTQDVKQRSVINGLDGAVHAVAQLPKGERVVTGTASGQLRILRLPDGNVVQELSADGARVTSIDVRNDGKWIVSGRRDGTVQLWKRSAEDWKLHVNLGPLPSEVRAVRLDEAKSRLYVVLAGESAIRYWDLVALNRELKGLLLP